METSFSTDCSFGTDSTDSADSMDYVDIYLSEDIGEQVVGYSDGVGDDGE